MKLDDKLTVRVEGEELNTFKERCDDMGVKYTVVIRNLMQGASELLSNEQLKKLGEKASPHASE